MNLCIALAVFLFSSVSFAAAITTNSVNMPEAPSWLNRYRVQRVTDRIERALEWDIRRVNVRWYKDQSEFQKVHGYDASVLAFARKSDNSVHIGPRVTTDNFDGVFGHELSHVILFQKYKDSIPKWLEEGLANYMARQGKVDYKWLAGQPQVDVTGLSHPFAKSSAGVSYHYMASQALMEMIASKCRISDLLQLSLGTKLESYLKTLCEINDLNAEFQSWVKRKSRS